MCGIVGVASTEGMKNKSARNLFMRMGLDIDSWRGWESTGLALVPEASGEAPIVYKRAINGRDFIQLNLVDKYLSDMEKYSVAIGHNRAATTGRGNIVDHNAHPFQYGNITLVHNGHIRNTHELKGAQQGAQCLVDSAHVAFSMNANGEKETLEQVDGGFVFVWWNSETRLLNIARNTERPLFMAFAHKENTFYWASELTELLHLLRDIPIDEDIGILYPKPWTWYQFDLKNLREYKKVPFVKGHGRQNLDTRIGPTGDVDEAAWEYETGATRIRDSSVRTSRADSSEIEEIRQTVANQRLKDAKMSGVPTSKKRVLRAKSELKKLGIEYDSLRVCRPISWCKYKNQSKLGSVIAQSRRDGRLIEVLQISNEDYLRYMEADTLLVNCVNVRNRAKNGVSVVGIVSPRMEDYLTHRNKSSKTTSLGSINRDYDGPGGVKISLARFSELTARGCASCCSDIEPKQHGAIIWIGNPEAPVCLECSSDPEVMELLGFPKHVSTNNIH